jgi:hypothetical protein
MTAPPILLKNANGHPTGLILVPDTSEISDPLRPRYSTNKHLSASALLYLHGQTLGNMIDVLTSDKVLKAYRKLTKHCAAHFHSRVKEEHLFDPCPAPYKSGASVRSSKLHETLIRE